MSRRASQRGATVVPSHNFDRTTQARALKAAIESSGSGSETDIIKIMVSHNTEQRLIIAEKYRDVFKASLVDALRKRLGGDLEQVVMALMTPPRVYDARELRKAIRGFGTDDKALIDILCTRSNDEIEDIRSEYQREFNRNLQDDIECDTSGGFKNMLLELCQAKRADYDYADPEMAAADAKALFDAGEGKFGTEESPFQRLLCRRPKLQLFLTFSYYEKLAKKTIEDAIRAEFSGDAQRGYLAIVTVTRDPRVYFARRLYESMHGIGTDDDTLIRTIVSRSEVDLKYIRKKFFELHGKSLREFITDDCTGPYKRILLEIIGDEEDDQD